MSVCERTRDTVEAIKAAILLCKTPGQVLDCCHHHKGTVDLLKASEDPYARTMAIQIRNLAEWHRKMLRADGK